MIDLAKLLADPALEASVFPSTSRYYGALLQIAQRDNAEDVLYVARRFPPQLDELEVQRRVTVVQGDRLDLLAAAHFADPSQWWRIADSNISRAVDELTAQPGSELFIATPRSQVGG